MVVSKASLSMTLAIPFVWTKKAEDVAKKIARVKPLMRRYTRFTDQFISKASLWYTGRHERD